MKLEDLKERSVLLLGFGTEGQATYEFIRSRWPSKPLIIADKREEVAERLKSDPAVTLRLGPDHLKALSSEEYDVIIKTPGIPASLKEIVEAYSRGVALTSHSDIFLANYPREKVIGITGTKGKSTTTALIHHILKSSGVPAHLVGNIGSPPLLKFGDTEDKPYFVHEFSSHQLAEITSSPHIAVLLNIVPEHLDYYKSFEEYVSAKENITRFQAADDFLVFSDDYEIPKRIAGRTRARAVPVSSARAIVQGMTDIPLPGKFNLQNVMAATAVATLCGLQPDAIGAAVRTFQPLPHRIERVGTYRGITFYDDSIATVPEAALAAVDALGSDVQTLILGGYDRHLEFDDFAKQLPRCVETVILFFPSGERIWAAIRRNVPRENLPEAFFVESMQEAVEVAYKRTSPGKICLLSPASPSFGTFVDYRDRGDSFKKFVRQTQ